MQTFVLFCISVALGTYVSLSLVLFGELVIGERFTNKAERTCYALGLLIAAGLFAFWK